MQKYRLENRVTLGHAVRNALAGNEHFELHV